MGKSRKTPFFFGKYYEGFTTVEEIDKNGKAYSKRVYVDFYYQAQLNGREKRLHKAVNILFTLLAVLFLAVSMTIRVPSNYYWFTTLPQALGVIPVLWQIYLAGLYVSAEPKQTIWSYRQTSVNLKRTSSIGAVCYSISAAGAFICGIVYRGEFLKGELLCTGGFILAAAALWIIYILEKNVRYEKIQSEYEKELYDIE